MKSFFFLVPIILYSLLLIDGGCTDKDCPNALEFSLPLQAYGIKDTLHLGDTLRIQLHIPDKLKEINSGMDYDFIDYNFKLITYLIKIDSLPVLPYPAGAFDWTTSVGESRFNGEVFLVLPTYQDNNYLYEVMIIPKRKGLFNFGMNNTGDSWANPLEKPKGPCSKRPIYIYVKLENDTNSNFEFLKLSPDPVQANIDRERFDRYAGFCFFVK